PAIASPRLLLDCMRSPLVPRLQTSPLFPYTTLFRSKRSFGQKGHELSAAVTYLDYWENSDQRYTQYTFLPDGTEQPAQAVVQTSDRKSTRLNSSHVSISYAVFCLKKKTAPYHTSSAP